MKGGTRWTGGFGQGGEYEQAGLSEEGRGETWW